MAPPHFRGGGHGFSTFLTVLFQSKRHPSRHAVKSLTWWKLCTKWLHLRLHFQKNFNFWFWGGHIPLKTPLCLASATAGAIAPVLISWRNIFDFQNLAPNFENHSSTYESKDYPLIFPFFFYLFIFFFNLKGTPTYEAKGTCKKAAF